MSKIKSIVTGGAGFIGSNLVDRLVSDGHFVTVLDNLSTGRYSNISHHKKNKVKFIKIDISKSNKLKKILRGNSYVFHLAGLADIVPSIKNPKAYFRCQKNDFAYQSNNKPKPLPERATSHHRRQFGCEAICIDCSRQL